MNPNLFSLKQTSLRWKEHITPHGQLFQLYINPGVFSVDRWIESEKHETRLFLLTSCPRESSSRHWTTEWKGPDDEPRRVLYKTSNRPDRDCIKNSTRRRAQSAYLQFHPSSSDAIVFYEKMPTSALDKVVTFAGEDLVDRKTPTSIKPEATLANELTCECQVDFENFTHTEWERSKSISHFQLIETRLELY